MQRSKFVKRPLWSLCQVLLILAALACGLSRGDSKPSHIIITNTLPTLTPTPQTPVSSLLDSTLADVIPQTGAAVSGVTQIPLPTFPATPGAILTVQSDPPPFTPSIAGANSAAVLPAPVAASQSNPSFINLFTPADPHQNIIILRGQLINHSASGQQIDLNTFSNILLDQWTNSTWKELNEEQIRAPNLVDEKYLHLFYT